MNNGTNIASGTQLVDRIAVAVVSRLDDGLQDIPHDITERLRAAREQALSLRKRDRLARRQPAVQIGAAHGGAIAIPTFAPQRESGEGMGEGLGLWQWIGSALPIVCLFLALVAVDRFHSESRAQELAEVDTALLADDVPPSAYADPGFHQFLQAQE